EGEELSDEQRAARLVLGFRYRSAAVISDPADEDSAGTDSPGTDSSDTDSADTYSTDPEDPNHPSGRPGFRAPHAWLHRDGEKLSTVDLFGHGFVLLTGAEGGIWTAAADDVAARLGITLQAHTIAEDLTGYGIEASGASLVRPDGVIAWRTTEAPDDPAAVLLQALTTVLAR
ncbi:hypothetical protein KGQ20_33000, partial [Catenulispora sp. NF23]|nr:hypothetical protein [Catenulispora pinistramenti]